MMTRAATVAAALVLLLLLLQLLSAEAQVGGAGAGPPASCPSPDRCGNVEVPYPFGIRTGCSLPGFGLTCDATPRLLLGNGTLPVVEISLANFTVRVLDLAGAVNITYSAVIPPSGNGTWASLGAAAAGGGGPYVVSERHNQLVVTGCNVQATLAGDSGNVITGCSSFCPVSEMFTEVAGDNATEAFTCSGTRCCETPVVIGRPTYLVQFNSLDPNQEFDNKLPIAVRIAERGWFDGVAANLLNNSPAAMDTSQRTPVPVVLEWALASTTIVEVIQHGVTNWSCPTDAARTTCLSSNSYCQNVTGNYRSGHVCRCKDGYDGNPYLAGAGGCQDVDECKLPGNNCFGECINTPGSFLCQCPRGAHGNATIPRGCVKSNLGLSVGVGVGSGAGLLVVALGAVFLTRNIKRRRARMQRQRFFKQNRGNLLQQLVSQKADIAERMIIPLSELEKATNNFDASRELGGGGHGTVYKGILSDLHVVAIKKSKAAIQREIDEFINEVAILSQINHRNVVKLYGCCLETQVPLLAYEFISNGTLYHHLHVEGPISLQWEDRLRIATESARALAYLHSDVSFPIIHRDIKSHNILLDGSLTTKVSDFGASRCIPAEQTGVETAIQGTLGYLDPMYYYTGRLTEKSDVFSFGVLLIELLTRKKPYSYRSPKDDGLVSHFTSLLTQGNLVDILDPQVVQEGGQDVAEVATLAAACVNLKAEERPIMRQVELTLESIRSAALQQDVKHSVGTNKSKENHVSWNIPTSEVTSSVESSTRQYSLEQEYLLSSRYPR